MYSNSQNDFKRKVEHKVSPEFSKFSHQKFQRFYPKIFGPGRPGVSNFIWLHNCW